MNYTSFLTHILNKETRIIICIQIDDHIGIKDYEHLKFKIPILFYYLDEIV